MAVCCLRLTCSMTTDFACRTHSLCLWYHAVYIVTSILKACNKMHQNSTVTVLFSKLNAQLAGSKHKSMFLISGPACGPLISISSIYMNFIYRPAEIPASNKGPSATAVIRQMAVLQQVRCARSSRDTQMSKNGYWIEGRSIQRPYIFVINNERWWRTLLSFNGVVPTGEVTYRWWWKNEWVVSIGGMVLSGGNRI